MVSLKNITGSLFAVLPGAESVPRERHPIIFPFWHAVSDRAPGHFTGLFRLPAVSQFERDLDFLLKNYRPVQVTGPADFSSGMNAAVSFFPTFDDGLSECFHIIAPILKRKGIQAAFFINPQFVGNRFLFHRHKAGLLIHRLTTASYSKAMLSEIASLAGVQADKTKVLSFLKESDYARSGILDQIGNVLDLDFDDYLKTNQPYMTLEQIHSLQNQGFLIGAHGLDHREFYRSDEDEMLRQIEESINFVVQEFQPEYKWFAFPFTDSKVPDAVFDLANRSKLWDVSFGTAGLKDEHQPKHIQRIPMESDRYMPAEIVLRNEYAWYRVKSVFGKNKVKRI